MSALDCCASAFYLPHDSSFSFLNRFVPYTTIAAPAMTKDDSEPERAEAVRRLVLAKPPDGDEERQDDRHDDEDDVEDPQRHSLDLKGE